MAEQQSRDMTKQSTRTEREEKRRFGVNGTGKDRPRVLFQSGENKKNMFEHIGSVENLLNRILPHVFFMCENLLDEKTKGRLTVPYKEPAQ